MNKYAPVVIYTYTRLEHLKKTVDALSKNYLASETDLYISSDAGKNKKDQVIVDCIRKYVGSIVGFKSVVLIEKFKNIGVYQSVQEAEEIIFAKYDKLITLEDDIVTSRNFLDFINEGLTYFCDDRHVLTISGYCHPIEFQKNYQYDSWKSPWFMPWGYGTWKEKWKKINIDYNPLPIILKNTSLYQRLKTTGNFFLVNLHDDYESDKKITDARVCGQMLLANYCTVIPKISKVHNIGNDGSGVHSSRTNRYDVVLDEGALRHFNFYLGPLDINEFHVRNYLRFMNGNEFAKLRNCIYFKSKNNRMLRGFVIYFKRLIVFTQVKCSAFRR